MTFFTISVLCFGVRRWEALSWPYKIMQIVEKTLLVLEEDYERFAKLQASDTVSMEERLSSLTVCIKTLSLRSDNLGAARD